MREIPLNRGVITIVDDEDYEMLARHKWTAWWHKEMENFYAMRNEHCADGKYRRVYMHRQILRLVAGDPRMGDHIDSSMTLDNRRQNLRIATAAQNAWNRKTPKTNRSGFRGVHRDRHGWRARIRVYGKVIDLGFFASPHDAHKAYLNTERELHGEFAFRATA